MTSDPPQEPQRTELPIRPATTAREIDSRDLMQGAREIVIWHGHEAYRLSVTRAGKLILRK